MFDINRIIGTTPATIRAAFNTSKEILEEYGDMGNCNATSILTQIIQDVGRFNEHWSSDALYGLDKIRGMSEQKFELSDGQTIDEIVCFGIRKDGVDHSDYVLQNLNKDRNAFNPYVFPDKYYRRILAVRCRAGRSPGLHTIRVEFSLRDISHGFHGIDPADLDASDPAGLKLRSVQDYDVSPEPAEPYRQDRNEIEKAMVGSLKSFAMFDISRDDLSKDGCDDNVECVEIRGFYGDPVPPNRDTGEPVCRVYAIDKSVIICWINIWYKHYDDVKKLLDEAKNLLHVND